MEKKSRNSLSNVYIIGAGGFGRELEAWVKKSQEFKRKYRLSGFIDDCLEALDHAPSDYKVLGKIDEFLFKSGDYALLGIADPKLKRDVVKRLNGKVKFLSFISDEALIGNYVEIGEGSVVAPFAVITTNVKIGQFVSINLSSHIGHDCTISDYSSIMNRVCLGGRIKISESVFIGTSSTIIPGKTIGENATLSAGCVVGSDVKPSSLMIGNPARNIAVVISGDRKV